MKQIGMEKKENKCLKYFQQENYNWKFVAVEILAKRTYLNVLAMIYFFSY